MCLIFPPLAANTITSNLPYVFVQYRVPERVSDQVPDQVLDRVCFWSDTLDYIQAE